MVPVWPAGSSKQQQLNKEREGYGRMNKWWRISRQSILVAAGLSFLLSVYLWFSGSKEQGIFVGLWVPSILAFGAFVFAGRGEK
jgi:hypothetical protein